MYLKLNTAMEREKVKDSETYKDAVKFYESLDNQGMYSSAPMTISAYYILLKSVKTFKQERQLLSFITEEDKCFRSLMNYLSKVSNSDLQNLTNATTAIFDDLYSSVGNKSDDVNDRTMLYLTMRFNRRIIQMQWLAETTSSTTNVWIETREPTINGCSFSRSWLLMIIQQLY